MENNDFIVQLIAALQVAKSKKQVNSDIKQIEKSLNLVRLTATLLRRDSKKAIKEQINQIQLQLAPVRLAAKLDEKQAQRAVNNALKNVKFNDIDININQNSLNLKLRKALSSANSHIPKITIPVDYDIKKQRLQNELTSYLTKNSKIRESSGLLSEGDDLKALFDRINDKKSFTEATERFRLYKSEVQATGYAGASTTEKLKNMVTKIGQIGSMFGVGAIMVRKFSDSLKTLKDNSTTLTEIAKTSEMTARQIQAIGDSSFGVASKYGIRSSGYLEGVREMSRSGYNELSKELGELSVLAQSAGDMTADSANNYLLATDAAYKYKGSIEQLTAALDGANYISNKNSSTLTDIADGVRVSASYAAEAGVQIDELTAAEATMIATTKRSGSEMGRAFRSILLNLQQVKGEFDGEIIDEESLKKVEARCHSLGVELETMTSEGAKLRNPMEILKELAQVYNSLPDSSVDKQGIISDIGGKYHANALAALLSNWSSYEKMLGEFSQGTGSSLKEAAKTADSWEGRLNALQNQWDSFVNHVTDQNTIKNGISIMDVAISGAEKLVDTLGAIPTLLTVITGAYTLLNKDYGITQIMNPESGRLDIQGKYLGVDITALKAQKTHFAEATDAIAKWNNRVRKGDTDINKFGLSVVKNNAQLKEYLSTCTDGSASMAGYRASLKAAGVETEALRLKTVLMTSAMSLGLGVAIQAGISLITKFIDEHVHAQERALEAAQEASTNIKSINDTYASHKKTVEDLADSYDKLSKGINKTSNKNISLSTEDYDKFLDINKQLAEAFPQLISTIDENGNAILNLGSNGKSASDDLRELLRAEEDLQNYKIAQNLGNLFGGVKVQIDEATNGKEAFDEEIKQTEESLDHLRDLASGKITIGENISFSGDLLNEADSSYYNVINSAAQEFYKALSGARRVELADTLDTSKLIHMIPENTAFDLYLNTSILTEDEKQTLSKMIEDQSRNVVGNISDSVGKSVQEQSEKTKTAQLAWKDYLAHMVSGMKSEMSFKELDESMQDIATRMVSGLQMNVAQEMEENDPYSYIRDNIISPLTYLSEEDSKKLSDAYGKLFSFDMEKVTPDKAFEEIEKYINRIAEIIGKTPAEIKLAFGFGGLDELAENFENAITSATDKFWPQFKNNATSELKSLEQDGSIDFLIRPQIDTSELEKAGWGEQEPGIATVYSSTYTNEDGTNAVVVTPILPDGKVLSPEDLEAYANDLLAGKPIDVDIKMGMFEGMDAQKQADEFANTIHNLHDTLFVGKEDSLWDQLHEFFEENSINTPEEISRWNEIAANAKSAAEAMNTYLAINSSVSQSFAELFSSLPIDQLEEYVALLKSGTIDEKSISSYSELSKIMQQTGISAKDAVSAMKEFSDSFTLSKDLISGIQDGFNLIESAKKNIKELKVISLDTLNSITAKYPQLQDEAAAYTQGLITTEDMMYALQTAYDADADNFRNAMASKLSGNETFFSTIKNNNQGLFDELANAYGLDVKNWKTMAQAKAEIDQALIRNLSSAWSKYYNIVFDSVSGLASLDGGPDLSHVGSHGTTAPQKVQEAWSAANAQKNKYNQIISALNEAANIEVEVPDFGGIGANKSGSKDKKEKEPTIFDWIAVAAEQSEKKIEKLQNKLNDTSGWKPKNTITDTTIDEMANKLTSLQAMADSYQKEADSYDLSPTYIDKIKNGTMEIESVTDEVIAKNIKSYQEWYDKAEEMRKQIDETKRSMKELAQSKLDNIINDFNSLTSLMGKYTDYLSGLLELQDSLGESTSDMDYRELIDQQEAIYDQLHNKYNALSSELKNAVDSGAIEIGSEEWRKYNEELIDVNSSMKDAVSSMNDFRQSIVNLSFKELDAFADKIDRINQGTNTLLNVLGNDGLMDNGMITAKGLAQLALYGQQYTNAKQQAAEYANAIDALNTMYEDGSITEAEYNERLKDYTSTQLSAVEATKAAEQAILQFRYDAIQAQIDDMNKLIDAKKKALQAEKDYQDYLESISNKQNDINNLQKKIDELALSSDRRDIAQRLELEKQLSDAKKELSDLEADYSYDQTMEGLDKEAEEYEEAKNNELKELKESYEKQQEVIKKYLSQVKDNYETVYKTLTEYGINYNVSMTDELTNPWSSADNAVNSFTDAVSSAVSKINIEISNIDISRLTELIDTMNAFSDSTQGMGGSGGTNFKDVSNKGSWKRAADGERWWYGNSDDDYVSGGVFTIDGKQYSFDDDGYMQKEWQEHNGKYHYFDANDGHMVKSQWTPGNNGEYYYLTSDGSMAANMAVKDKFDKNKYYYVDDGGVWDGETIDYEEVKSRDLKVGYRTGTRNATPGWHPINEAGPETLLDLQGNLVKLSGGEQIFDHQMSDTLWKFATDPTAYYRDNIMKGLASNHANVSVVPRNNDVTVQINSPLANIEGVMDEKMLGQVENMMNRWATKKLPDIIRKDMKGR